MFGVTYIDRLPIERRMNTPINTDAAILQALTVVQQQLHELREQVTPPQTLKSLSEDIADLRDSLQELTTKKDYYSTRDVAEMMSVTLHTVQERWCNQARIECEKDPESGQWLIPAHEFERLRRGGKPLSNRSLPY